MVLALFVCVCVFSCASEAGREVVTVVHHHPLYPHPSLLHPAHCVPHPLQPRRQVQGVREREAARSEGRSSRWGRPVLWICEKVCSARCQGGRKTLLYYAMYAKIEVGVHPGCDALNQWCLQILLGIKWYQFVRNDDAWRLTKQPKHFTLLQYSSRADLLCLGTFAHRWQCRCQEDPVSLPSGRLEKTTRSSPHHMAQHRPTGSETSQPYAPETADMAQNCGVWRVLSTFGTTQS